MSAKKKGKAPAGGSNLKMFYGALGGIAILGVAWIAWTASGRGSPAVEPIDLTGVDNAQALLQKADGMQAGSDSAPVPILIFSDFTCPGCQSFAQYMEPQIKAEYVQTGKVRYTYYDFPLGGNAGHRWGFVAARAARCASDQGKFWEYHDVLFARQGEWALSRNTPTSQLEQYADLVGLDSKPFSACLRSDRYAEAVTASRVLGEQLGVNSTPTVFIGSRSIPYNWTYEQIRDQIERELGGAGS
ncbi:MAG: DsbA family protein [Gemmatimonadota bacterium]